VLLADFRLLQDFLARMPGLAGLAMMMAGLLFGWWLYVPVHELLHVAGCLVAGGEVSRLELAPLYGGDLLEAWLPFVVSGSEYAGQLTGFDTGGSDWVYQSCVLMPYAITIFPGFWLWQRVIGNANPVSHLRMVLSGALLPVVAAPLMSLSGDYYESGSIIVSSLAHWFTGFDTDAWRSDDVFLLVGDWPGSIGVFDTAGIGAGVCLGAMLALGTMWAGSRLGRFLNARP